MDSVDSMDPCSFSSFHRCITKHLNLNLHVDFDRHVIRGRVALTVEALQDRLSTLVGLSEAHGCPADEDQEGAGRPGVSVSVRSEASWVSGSTWTSGVRPLMTQHS